MTAHFLSPLRTEKIGPQRWLLIDDLRYRSMLLPGVFCVTRGFQTDLASIPRWLWTILPKEDRYDAAAVLHDGAYAHALTTADGIRVELIKLWADRLFAEALQVCGVGRFQTALMAGAVRWFGYPEQHPLAANRVP